MSNYSIADCNTNRVTTDQFLASYTGLMEWLRSRLLAETHPDYLLNLASFYGQLRWSNSDGIYHDDEIEQYVADTILNDANFHAPVIAGTNQGTVLIASELYAAGGHSRVVLNWLKSFKEEHNHSLLITRSATKRFGDFLTANGYSYHLCSTHGIELVREIIQYCGDAQRIVLHIHPDDIISATAARYLASAGKDIIFYNHADHVFSYGISSASVVCEVSSYGIALSRRTKRAKRSCYLGIPIDVDSPNKSNEAHESPRQTQIVLTSGASYKYKPAAIFFGDFIDRLLLQRPDAIIVLVGPTGREAWWKNTVERWGYSVRFLGELPHDQYAKVMASAAVYVDSFPMSGGTAFPEALLNGKQVAGLQNPVQGYTPADELRVNTVEGLARRVVDLLGDDAIAKKDIERAKLKATEAHSLNTFRKRVLASYAGKCDACPWERLVNVDTYWLETEWKARTEVQYEVTRILYLPFSFCLVFLVKVYRLHKPPRLKFVAFAISRLILRVLPRSLRNHLIRLRETFLKRVG